MEYHLQAAAFIFQRKIRREKYVNESVRLFELLSTCQRVSF